MSHQASASLRGSTRNERDHARRARKRLAHVGLTAGAVQRFLQQHLGQNLHAKTVLSISLATLGALHAAGLAIHVIGRALAWARGKDPKHCIKQVDRLLSNPSFSLELMAKPWVDYVLAGRPEAVIALDWTEFDDDDHSTLCAYLVTNHGRATPLLWKTVYKSALARKRNRWEDELLEQLRAVIPESCHVTILADRGFGDQKRYKHIRSLNFDYIIRFRQDILVTDQFGDQKPAIEWLRKNGHARMLKDMAVTGNLYIVPAVVVVHGRRMADPWCLATSRADLVASAVVRLYGRRFTIEESFRDTKDIHFGCGLSATHIKDATRRDRLLFIAALAQVLLSLLGAAGERCGLDRTLKSSTTKRRTLSLFNQGCYWYNAIPNMRDDRLALLMQAYSDVLREHQLFQDLFGPI